MSARSLRLMIGAVLAAWMLCVPTGCNSLPREEQLIQAAKANFEALRKDDPKDWLETMSPESRARAERWLATPAGRTNYPVRAKAARDFEIVRYHPYAVTRGAIDERTATVEITGILQVGNGAGMRCCMPMGFVLVDDRWMATFNEPNWDEKLAAGLDKFMKSTPPSTGPGKEGMARWDPDAALPKLDNPLEYRLSNILTEISAIRPGMTRADAMKVFTTEGGISTRTFVYRTCPYIKADVTFEPVGEVKPGEHDSPADIVKEISKPYLQWSVID